MKRIAIITGATGGIGEEFAKQICADNEIDEIWAIGRNQDKLNLLKSESAKILPVRADFSTDGVEVIRHRLEELQPEIRILINNAGVAYMGLFEKMEEKDIVDFCKINCSVPAELISIALPYMSDGARIINISSASSFQPNPYLSMYSSSKVFLKNLSRALNVELRSRKITVTCVCPGWVDTGMLPKEKDGRTIKYSGMISSDKVVKKALRDSRKGKDISLPGFFANYFRLYSKIMPTKIVMKQWVWGIRKYI